jgi:methyl-accepting chemotaxis protein
MSVRYSGSIRTKVVLITLVCTTLVLSAVGIFDTYRLINAEKEKLSNLANVTAERLAQHLMIPVWDLDTDRIGSAIEAEMLETSLLGVVVYDENGTSIMGAKERDHNWGVVGSSGNIVASFASAKAEIRTADKLIGSVTVFVSDRFISKVIQNAVINEVVRTVAVNAVIFFILVLLLGKFLISPILTLAEQAREISTGKLNAVIEIKSNDEIGMLADSLTRMQKSLIVAFKKIRQNNRANEQ